AIKQMDMALEREVARSQRFVEEVRYEQERRGIMLDDLRDQVLGLMLRPLDSVFSTFPRAVRDIAVRSGKQVRLLIGGESVEMDQAVAESLVEPLVHLINNAVAHGIEMPDQRSAAGKPAEGQVTILARQSGSEIRLEVIDDGVGISVDNVRRKAIERGVTTQFEADAMSPSEILELIFRPGFSTREKVDDISGRGIGMNIVQDAIRKLTGSIRIHTEEGKGTRFIISLPVSIAVQHALMFRIGSQRLGMLSHMIEQVVPFKEQLIEKGEGDKTFIRYGNRLVPLVDLRLMLDDTRYKLASYGMPYVVVAEHIEGYVGIVVSELYEETEIIIRDIDPYLKRYQSQGLMGNTIIGDGSVILLIEPYGIKEMGRTAPDMRLQQEGGETAAMQPFSGQRLMLVDDSIIARQVEKALLESLGFDVDTAIDGLDALEKLKMHSYDIIVTDLEMPRLDGFGLVRQLRNVPQYEDMPILIISTRESAEDRMRALESGADAYLVKQQLEPAGLQATMQSLVGALTPAP
ncbi:MAG TPA: response regulator, partial [Mariprofundaceae bacterium]|nr:response regulator [Mariprofundaceae bacterium]